MIDISPKALRFARLAAEQQSAFAGDPEIAVIRREETLFGRRPSNDRAGQYVKISERTADFCVRAMTAMLTRPEIFESSDWDGNDFAFMQVATKSLREQVLQSNAQML